MKKEQQLLYRYEMTDINMIDVQDLLMLQAFTRPPVWGSLCSHVGDSHTHSRPILRNNLMKQRLNIKASISKTEYMYLGLIAINFLPSF